MPVVIHDMAAEIRSNKKINPIVTKLFLRERKYLQKIRK